MCIRDSDESLADAHCVGLGLGGIGRDVGGAHPEHRLLLDDIRCLKIFREMCIRDSFARMSSRM